MPFGHTDRRRELLAAWERRCRTRGGTEHCAGADALFLVTALSNALRHASETPELGRAARTWGARFSAPVDALATLANLRDALVEIAENSPDGLPVPLSVLNRIFDQAALEAVDTASANLRSEARNDPLTGCANRRALDEELTHAAASARRSNLDLSVAVIDLDGLKQINDTQGHAAGDAALISLVAALRRALREADTLYRTGGDEFVVVAPFTDAAGARALMRRAERAGGPPFSWGVTSLAAVAAAGPDTAVLMDAADSDLYERRRATRRATVLAARRRTATAVASVAASVAVTAAMAGLAVAVDSGSAVHTANAASSTSAPGGGSGNRTDGGSAAPRWAAPRLGAVGGGAGPGATLSSQAVGQQPGGLGPLGTSLVGLLETVVPPTAGSPGLGTAPGVGSPAVGGGITVTLPTFVVSSSGPVALASAPGPVTAAAGNGGGAGAGSGGTGSTGVNGNGSNGAGSGTAGNGNGNGNGDGHGNGGGDNGGNGGGGGGVTSVAPTAPGGGHGPKGGRAGHGKG